MDKEWFEQWLWESVAAEICQLYSGNGIFNAKLFVKDCKKKFQTQSISGVGAHHQNALAEHSIQTIMYMAQTYGSCFFALEQVWHWLYYITL